MTGSQRRVPAEDRELSPREFLAFLFRRRRMLALATALGVAVSVVVTLLQTPSYTASGRVRVVEQSPLGGIGAALAQVPFLGLGAGGSSATAEIEMIRSRPIAEAVVDPPGTSPLAPEVGLDLVDAVYDLDQVEMWRVLRRKFTVEAAQDGAVAVDFVRWGFGRDFAWPLRVTFLGPDEVEVSVHRWWSPEPERLPFRSGEPLRYREATFVLTSEGDLTGRSFLVFRRDRRDLVETFLEDLEVLETSPGSSVIVVKQGDVTPEGASARVNAVLRAYVAQNKQRKLDSAGRNVEFLEAELERVRDELAQAEERLRAFGQRAGDVALPETAGALIEELVKLDVERATVELELRTNEALLERIRSGALTDLEVAGLEANVLVPDGQTEPMAEMLATRGELRAEYTDEWPALRELEGRIADRRAAIVATLEGKVAQDRGVRDGLEELLARYGEKLGGMPEAQVELLGHKRSVETFGQIYALLLGELERARVTVASTVPSVEIVDWAVPPRYRSSPGVKLNLLLGALVGLLLGVAFALVGELSRPLTTVAQVEEACGVRVLHAVPRARRERSELPARDAPEGRAAESYRALRTAFDATVGDGVTAVVGPHANAGASRTAANLAWVLARAGRRVLLVDLDGRAGVVAARFGARAEGLAAVLAGEQTLEDVLQPGGVEGLALAAGAGGELPSDARLRALFDAARSAHDVVLVDVPPCLEFADAAQVAAAAGRALLVLPSGDLPEEFATQAADRLRAAGAELVGVVFNGVRRPAGVV